MRGYPLIKGNIQGDMWCSSFNRRQCHAGLDGQWTNTGMEGGLYAQRRYIGMQYEQQGRG